jgi:hypothetical protein
MSEIELRPRKKKSGPVDADFRGNAWAYGDGSRELPPSPFVVEGVGPHGNQFWGHYPHLAAAGDDTKVFVHVGDVHYHGADLFRMWKACGNCGYDNTEGKDGFCGDCLDWDLTAENVEKLFPSRKIYNKCVPKEFTGLCYTVGCMDTSGFSRVIHHALCIRKYRHSGVDMLVIYRAGATGETVYPRDRIFDTKLGAQMWKPEPKETSKWPE